MSRSKASATKEANTPIASAKAEIGKTRVVVVKSPSESQERLGLCTAAGFMAMEIVYRRAIHYEAGRLADIEWTGSLGSRRFVRRLAGALKANLLWRPCGAETANGCLFPVEEEAPPEGTTP